MTGGAVRTILMLGAGSVLLPISARATDDAAAAQSPISVVQPYANPATPGVRYNSTGRVITLTVPLKDGANYLGDVPLTIQPDDTLEMPTRRTLQLLALVLDPRFF